MKCQCESALCTHNKRGEMNPCPNEATYAIRTNYGIYKTCRRCSKFLKENMTNIKILHKL